MSHVTTCQHTSRSISAKYKLIITGANAIPDEITVGAHVKRHDMANSQEEAHVVIVNQVMSAARHGYKTIDIVCDDTRVCIIGTFLQTTEDYYVWTQHITCL